MKATLYKINLKILFLIFAVILGLITCEKPAREMMVKTGEVTNITDNSVEVSGNIIDAGKNAIQYGHCYSKNPDPTIVDTRTQLKKADQTVIPGDFKSNLTGLDAGTKYYARAYITDGTINKYGSIIYFTTINIPVYVSSVIENATPALLEMTYSLTLDNTSVPAASAFTVTVNSTVRSVSSVVISGTKVQLTLTSPVAYGDTVTVAYTKPSTNPLKTTAGGQAASITAQNVTNNVVANKPSTTTTAATSVSCTSATLNGTVNANGSSTTVTFEYGTTISYGSTIPATPNSVTGTTATSVSANLSGLSTCTTYHFRVKAVSAGGTTYGDDQTFTTLCQPTATTSAASSVASTSATLNGSVNANGSSTTVTFEYGTTTSYGSSVTATQSPATGSTTTSVSANLTGLSGCTTYHYRVKAVNACGTVYGSDQTFTTLCGPSATTNTATEVTSTSATLNGTVNAKGYSTVVTFEYGLTASYGIEVTADQSPATGNTDVSVSKNITGLSPSTTYHYRVKAESSQGITYGSDMTLTTPAQVSDVDGNVYNTVKIGTQLWMQENLKTTRLNDGTPIALVTDNSSWANTTTPAYCWYNNDGANKNTYGALYNYYTLETGKLCPLGWHVPSDEEWTTMENYLITNGYNYDGTTSGNKIAKALSSTTLWYYSTVEGSPGNSDFQKKRNITGWSALPGGFRHQDGTFLGIVQFARWMSSTITVEYGTEFYWLRSLSFDYAPLAKTYADKRAGDFARCIKDQ